MPGWVTLAIIEFGPEPAESVPCEMGRPGSDLRVVCHTRFGGRARGLTSSGLGFSVECGACLAAALLDNTG